MIDRFVFFPGSLEILFFYTRSKCWGWRQLTTSEAGHIVCAISEWLDYDITGFNPKNSGCDALLTRIRLEINNEIRVLCSDQQLENELSHSQMMDNLREQVVLCDEPGFDAVWLAEHHLNPEGFGNSPNPIVLAADLASRTSRIKIGFSCVTATMWHPIRLAEDLALLDHLTKGRIEVGFGRGGRPSDTIPFNLKADPRDEETNRRLFIETMDIVVGVWTNEFFSHEGPNYTIPPKGLPHHPSYASEEPYVVNGEVT